MVNFSFKLFFFLGGGRGFYLRSVAPSAPKPHHPHCTFKGCDSAIAPHVFKFVMKPNSARDFKLNLIKSDRKI